MRIRAYAELGISSNRRHGPCRLRTAPDWQTSRTVRWPSGDLGDGAHSPRSRVSHPCTAMPAIRIPVASRPAPRRSAIDGLQGLSPHHGATARQEMSCLEIECRLAHSVITVADRPMRPGCSHPPQLLADRLADRQERHGNPKLLAERPMFRWRHVVVQLWPLGLDGLLELARVIRPECPGKTTYQVAHRTFRWQVRLGDLEQVRVNQLCRRGCCGQLLGSTHFTSLLRHCGVESIQTRAAQLVAGIAAPRARRDEAEGAGSSRAPRMG